MLSRQGIEREKGHRERHNIISSIIHAIITPIPATPHERAANRAIEMEAHWVGPLLNLLHDARPAVQLQGVSLPTTLALGAQAYRLAVRDAQPPTRCPGAILGPVSDGPAHKLRCTHRLRRGFLVQSSEKRRSSRCGRQSSLSRRPNLGTSVSIDDRASSIPRDREWCRICQDERGQGHVCGGSEPRLAKGSSD